MKLDKLPYRARQGMRLIRNEGLASFTIRALQIIKEQGGGSVEKNKLLMPVKYPDALIADPASPPPRWKGTSNKQLTFSWVMPPPGKGSGGHMTIFRFIKYLEEAGHTCHIYYYGVHGNSPIKDIRSVMGTSFPAIKAEMKWLDSPDEIKPTDGVIATSWETAYPIHNSRVNAKRFYFVQDFEPFFYPVGSLSVLAENTYKFGFHGVTAGNWLATKLTRDYGMQTNYFNFGSDSKVYTYDNSAPRKEILYYCRPYTARRGFELAVMALDLFHKKHPEYVINLFGHDVSRYKIPFPCNNLKTLEHHELNELYNRCSAGLVMSLTNMSLLPLELLGCGAIPVVNKGENNTLVSDNAYIAYSNPDPASLASKLSEVVMRKDLVSYAQGASESVRDCSWDESGRTVVKIFEDMTRKSD